MLATSKLEISKSALAKNITFLKKFFGKKHSISSVVKGNAYGHGLSVFAPLVEELGIKHFSVFSAGEAYSLRRILSPKSDILIMGLIDNEDIAWAIENDIHFFVFETDRLEVALYTAKKIGKPAKVHIELETGMNRTGFQKQQLGHVTRLLSKNHDYLHFEGLCTHYAGAESVANYLRIKKQISTFKKLIQEFVENDLYPAKIHSACSAASISYPSTRYDMLRIGILQYGFWPSKETQMDFLNKTKRKIDPLERVLSWKTSVMSVKYVSKGEFIGYGTTFLAEQPIKIAIVPVGYSLGFSRSLSNTGRALVKGQRVGVIGYVNMNLMLLDVTAVPEVHKGDEVVLIGSQGDHNLSVASFSELSNQLNYELLTRLPDDLPRIVVE